MIKRLLITCLLGFWCIMQLASAGDPFTVSGVKVDAMGSNAIEAQTKANMNGQMMAAQILLNRVTLPTERLGKDFSSISPETVARMIRALSVSNERRSNQRYLGDITVAFVPSEVEKYLASEDMSMVSSRAGERLLIPVLSGNDLWTMNDWHKSWARTNFANALTPLNPLSISSGNNSLINADQVQSLNLEALKRLGNYFDARQLLIAVAEPIYGSLSSSGDMNMGNTASSIQVRIIDMAIDTGLQRDLGYIQAPTYHQATWDVLSRLEDDWKSSLVKRTANAVSMPVSVLYRSHADWVWLQSVINNSAAIQGARLDALSKDGALMSVTYGGDFHSLKTELNYKGVELRRDPELGTILVRKGRY